MDRAAEAEAVRAAVELADGRLRPAHPLYTGLMAAIGQQGVRHQVRDVYAKGVADHLGTHPFGGPAAKLLAEGSVDPQRVIDRFGLPEGALLVELQRRLRLVTGDDAIRRALALLLDSVLGSMPGPGSRAAPPARCWPSTAFPAASAPVPVRWRRLARSPACTGRSAPGPRKGKRSSKHKAAAMSRVAGVTRPYGGLRLAAHSRAAIDLNFSTGAAETLPACCGVMPVTCQAGLRG